VFSTTGAGKQCLEVAPCVSCAVPRGQVGATAWTSRHGPLVSRAVLVERHARDRGELWRVVNAAAWIALARHADADAAACVGAGCCRATVDRDV
jgi:hypothetical protein